MQGLRSKSAPLQQPFSNTIVDPLLQGDPKRTEAQAQEELRWERWARNLVQAAVERWAEKTEELEGDSGLDMTDDGPWSDWYDELVEPRIDSVLNAKTEEAVTLRLELAREQLPPTVAYKRQWHNLQRVIAVLHQMKELARQEEQDAYRRAREAGSLISQGRWYVAKFMI
ncbi:hypothetical protein EIP86_005328 [Pleurotus ostreatoroseus]|nr:hypothetical protein EIP86_005328 [Pleurotus ostreatoroseus]